MLVVLFYVHLEMYLTLVKVSWEPKVLNGLEKRINLTCSLCFHPLLTHETAYPTSFLFHFIVDWTPFLLLFFCHSLVVSIGGGIVMPDYVEIFWKTKLLLCIGTGDSGNYNPCCRNSSNLKKKRQENHLEVGDWDIRN